jgi:hypothetical protein
MVRDGRPSAAAMQLAAEIVIFLKDHPPAGAIEVVEDAAELVRTFLRSGEGGPPGAAVKPPMRETDSVGLSETE